MAEVPQMQEQFAAEAPEYRLSTQTVNNSVEIEVSVVRVREVVTISGMFVE
jgi:hypothetical protein